MTDKKQIAAQVAQLIAEDVTALGYDLVRVEGVGGGRYVNLQIMAERLDGAPMTLGDCTAISRATSAKIETVGDLADRVTLEVSSPGIDRPLVRLKDYERFAGHLARVELEAPLAALKAKRFQGKIVRISGEAMEAEIAFTTEAGEVRVPMKQIARARLVMTDALLEATSSNRK